MEKMRPPMVPERPVPVLSADRLRALVATCSGKSFIDRRDEAILRLFADTGLRLSELAHRTVADVDLDDGLATVMGKGRCPRAVTFGAKTTAALDRYLRMRGRHKRAAEPALWLGPKNRQAMTVNGIGQMVRRRGAEAGIPELHHTCSGTRSPTPGWPRGQRGRPHPHHRLKSRAMVNRYGASAADQRASDAHCRLALGDRL
jgi:site-specific recombinase XerC